MKKVIIAGALAAGVALTGCGQAKQKEAKRPDVITPENYLMVEYTELDLNKDGMFTYEEFDKITGNNSKPEGNGYYLQVDTDSSGIIELDEYNAAKGKPVVKAVEAPEAPEAKK